jgi:hypothetical protein
MTEVGRPRSNQNPFSTKTRRTRTLKTLFVVVFFFYLRDFRASVVNFLFHVLFVLLESTEPWTVLTFNELFDSLVLPCAALQK